MHRGIEIGMRSPWLRFGLAAFLVVTVGLISAQAGPSTLQIGGTNATGLDPVRIDDSSGLVTITDVQGGSKKNPENVSFSTFKLILGIPEPEGSSFTLSKSSIQSVTSTTSGPTSWSFETSTSGVLKPSDNGAKQDVYSQLHLSGPNASNNGTNWFAADQTYNGFTPPTFNLYVFDITAPLGPKGTVSVTFNPSLPNGSYAIAWGTATNGKIYGTPFTEAGLTVGPDGPGPHIAVPAPTSVVLLGFGGLGFGLFVVARSRRRLAYAA